MVLKLFRCVERDDNETTGITVECPSQSGIGLWRIAIKGDSLDRVFSLYGRINA